MAIDAIKRTLANNSRIQNDPDRAKYGENSNSGIVIISG